MLNHGYPLRWRIEKKGVKERWGEAETSNEKGNETVTFKRYLTNKLYTSVWMCNMNVLHSFMRLSRAQTERTTTICFYWIRECRVCHQWRGASQRRSNTWRWISTVQTKPRAAQCTVYNFLSRAHLLNCCRSK